MSSAASYLLARLIRERDELLEAAHQDATDPLPPVRADPDAGALCPSRVEGLWCAWQSNGTTERDRLYQAALLEMATLALPLLAPADRMMSAALDAHRELADALCNEDEPDLVQYEQRLQALHDLLPAVEAALARPAGNAPAAAATASAATDAAHPDDRSEGGCWVWWKGKRYDVPKGVAYRLLGYMWARDSASYGRLSDPPAPVLDNGDVLPGTLRGYLSRLNKVLHKAGIPWRLASDASSRIITKQLGTPTKGKQPRKLPRR